MKRWLFLVYGLAMYVMFLGVYAYFAGFVGNLVVPASIDSPVTRAVATAIPLNLLLVGIFAMQHSVMARPAFKRWWTRIIPQPIERSTYLLASNLATILLIWQWRPIDSVLWDVQSPGGRTMLWGLFAIGWLSVPAVTLLLNHFDLFGLRQVWLHFQGRRYTSLPFRVPLAYAHVRHPLYLAWALAFWATPTMTFGHLLFAASLTTYMALAAIVEESDLVAHFGERYG
jgi:protein-S-isoprenylcysteine O-methyltransferase Ste14